MAKRPPTPQLAPALKRLRREIDTRYRKRKSAPGYNPFQDAWLGDAAHGARKSEHNPDSRGIVHAMDIAVAGIHPGVVLGRVIGDPRVWYVIYAGHIWSARHNWKRELYHGPDAHTRHIHVSLLVEPDWPHRLARKAEVTTTGWGLASLLHPRMLIKYVRRSR